jgi:hypothetical protein
MAELRPQDGDLPPLVGDFAEEPNHQVVDVPVRLLPVDLSPPQEWLDTNEQDRIILLDFKHKDFAEAVMLIFQRLFPLLLLR